MGLKDIKVVNNITSKFDRLLLADMNPESPFTFTMDNTGFTVGLGKIANLFYRLLFTRKGTYFADPDFGSEFPDILVIPFGSESALRTFIGRSLQDVEAYIKKTQDSQTLPANERLATIKYEIEIVDLQINVYVKLISADGDSNDLILDSALFDSFISLV